MEDIAARTLTLAGDLAAINGRFTGDLSVSGSLLARGISAQSLSLENTLAVKDASVLGDLTVGGSISVRDLYVPNGVRIDGGLHAASLEVQSGAVINGTLTLNDTLHLMHGVVFESGSILFAHDIVVRDALQVIGSVTFEALAQFFGDVKVKGQLVLSDRQAGYAVLPKRATFVNVGFGSGGFIAQPIVTASPDVPVAFAVSRATQSGFTIRINLPAIEDITFSWVATLTEKAEAVQENSAVTPASDPVPKGEHVDSSAASSASAQNDAVTESSSSSASSESSGSVSSSSSASSESFSSSVSTSSSSSSSASSESVSSSSSTVSESSSSAASSQSSVSAEPVLSGDEGSSSSESSQASSESVPTEQGSAESVAPTEESVPIQ